MGRGVLLDVPRLRGSRWLEPGETSTRRTSRLPSASRASRSGRGDILLVRTGHARRARSCCLGDTAKRERPGLHPTSASFLAEREVAALGSDGNNDTSPSTTEGIDFPIHVLAINAMGVHLLDYLQFEDLVRACERADRWEFSVRRRPAADRWRHRIPAQPDQDPLTARLARAWSLSFPDHEREDGANHHHGDVRAQHAQRVRGLPDLAHSRRDTEVGRGGNRRH